METKKPKTGFSITGNRGFHITFENGVCVSVQFGRGNYADNYNLPIDEEDRSGLESSTAEVAIWDNTDPSLGSGQWLTKKCRILKASDVATGYVSPEDVAKVLVWASKYKRKVAQ